MPTRISCPLLVHQHTKAWQSFVRRLGPENRPTGWGQGPPAPIKPRCHACGEFSRRYLLLAWEAGAVALCTIAEMQTFGISDLAFFHAPKQACTLPGEGTALVLSYS